MRSPKGCFLIRVVLTIGDIRDYIRVLLYSNYTTITGWGVLLRHFTMASAAIPLDLNSKITFGMVPRGSTTIKATKNSLGEPKP